MIAMPDATSQLGQTVVMKFGGTSVADADRIKRAAERIVAAREAGNRVVAVLSARGKTTDEESGPVPAATTCTVLTSAIVLACDVCQTCWTSILELIR